MHARVFIFLLFIGILAPACKKEDLHPDGNKVKGLKRVWALDDGEKIKRDDISSPLASDINNSVWQDNEIHLFGGRNEIIAFQADHRGRKRRG